MARVKDYVHLDKTDNGIINNDDVAYRNALKRKSVCKHKDREIENMKADINELKLMVLALINKNGVEPHD